MHESRTPVFILGFTLFAAVAHAAPPPVLTAPEVVVTGKRLRGDHRSARVYTETELARESGRTIGEVLREEAGVDYLAGTGGNSNLLIRGSSGSQTLVLVDGVKANDPSATNRYFDWSRIDASEIERVEILKGPQAVSYGSDAIGGVVLITTKKGFAGATTASLEAGSEAFLRAHATTATDLGTFLGGAHELGFEALGKGVFAGGSLADSPDGRAMEGDDSREANAGLTLRSRWGRETRSTVTAFLRSAREDIDAAAFDDDPNSVARNREIRASATVDGAFDEGTEWGLVASHLDFRRAYSDLPDAAHPTTASDTVLRGTNSRGEFHLRSNANSWIEWTGGLEATRESLHIDSLLFPTVLGREDAETSALFAESVVPFTAEKRFAIDFGARYSHFTSYGNQWSGKAGATARPSETLELDAGLSTGFKAPSLYSLYDPQYGNPALQPEQSVQAEAGVSVHPSSLVTVSARAFESRIHDRFGFDPVSFRSLNVARARIRGAELESDATLRGGLRIAPSLTFLSTHDEATGRALPDVPKWKGALKFAYDLRGGHSFTLSFVAKSERGTSAGSARVAGFYRADLTTRHALSRAFTLTTRFENLLDHDYEEVRGYRAPGFSASIGLEFASL